MTLKSPTEFLLKTKQKNDKLPFFIVCLCQASWWQRQREKKKYEKYICSMSKTFYLSLSPSLPLSLSPFLPFSFLPLFLSLFLIFYLANWGKLIMKRHKFGLCFGRNIFLWIIKILKLGIKENWILIKLSEHRFFANCFIINSNQFRLDCKCN